MNPADCLLADRTILSSSCLLLCAKVRVSEALPRAVGQRRDAVGRQAQERGDLGRLGVFHGGVPQHHAPAFGQRPEGPGDVGPLAARASAGSTKGSPGA